MPGGEGSRTSCCAGVECKVRCLEFGKKPKLLDQLRAALRARHYSSKTEQAYCTWVKRYIVFHNVRHPIELAEPEINAFLTHLAVNAEVSASSQNQALSALLFLYRNVNKAGDGRSGSSDSRP